MPPAPFESVVRLPGSNPLHGQQIQDLPDAAGDVAVAGDAEGQAASPPPEGRGRGWHRRLRHRGLGVSQVMVGVGMAQRGERRVDPLPLQALAERPQSSIMPARPAGSRRRSIAGPGRR